MSVADSISSAAIRRDTTPDDTYELDRRRVYIFPTRFGFSFYAVLLVMLIGSINYNNSLGFLLTFLLGSLSLVAILHTYRNLAGMRLRLRAQRPVFAGQETRFLVQLDNRNGSQRFGLTIIYPLTPQEDDRQLTLLSMEVPGETQHTVELKVRTTKRGKFTLGRIVLASRFPLGLFRAWANFEPTTSAIVYPKAEGVRELPSSASVSTSAGGILSEGNDDFTGLRNYVPGDSSRRIHWKAVAKEQETFVKQFSGSAPTEVILKWSDTPQAALEARLSQLAWMLHEQPIVIEFSAESSMSAVHACATLTITRVGSSLDVVVLWLGYPGASRCATRKYNIW